MDNRVNLIISEINRLYDNGTLEKLIYYDGGNMVDLKDFFDACFEDDVLLDDFADSFEINNCDIKHGLQSLTFIFEDIVYKLTPYDLTYINVFIEYLNEEEIATELEGLSDLICPVQLVYDCNDYFIFKQERLFFDNPSSSNVASPVVGELTEELADSICNYYFDKDICIGYATRIIEEFSKCYISFIEDLDMISDDIHNGNWAYDKNDRPVIFDPFYIW